MSHWINLPLEAVDADFLAELKKQHTAGSRIELRVVDAGDPPRLPESRFWQIISRLDWDASTDVQILQPAVNDLAAGDTVDIFLFEDLLAEKLRALDTPELALSVYGTESRISVDGFLYLRAGVVALGREHFEAVLQNPARIDPDLDFEPLLTLADHAYAQKTGKTFAYRSHLSYETFSNEAAWTKR